MHGNIIIMAKFEGEDRESLKKLIKTRKFLNLLRRSEYINFWNRLISQIEDEIEVEFIDDELTDDSFNSIIDNLKDIDILPLLTFYDKKQINCIALIEDDILLDILRKCTHLLIEYDYPTFYF